MAVARQHISMHLIGHLLTYRIDIRFHYEHSALEEFGLVGCGEEFSDILRDLRGHVGWCSYILTSSSPFVSAPKTSCIGLSGATWAMILHCGVGGCAAITLARIASSSFFFRRSCQPQGLQVLPSPSMHEMNCPPTSAGRVIGPETRHCLAIGAFRAMRSRVSRGSIVICIHRR